MRLKWLWLLLVTVGPTRAVQAINSNRPSFRRIFCNIGSTQHAINSNGDYVENPFPHIPLLLPNICQRRHALSALSFCTSALFFPSPSPAAEEGDVGSVTLHIHSVNDRLGLELFETKIGTTSPRSVLAVRRVVDNASGVKPGMVLMEYGTKEELVGAIRSGVYPLDLKFYDLAMGGDAIGDMGRSIVSPESALDAARSIDIGEEDGGYVRRTVVKPSPCEMKSRRGDMLQIHYEGRIGSADGPIYDSSADRGTGQAYALVLGAGDVIPGVDLGLYDMCQGEVRTLDIPSALAYGDRGSKVYRVPGKSRLFWKVELATLYREQSN